MARKASIYKKNVSDPPPPPISGGGTLKIGHAPGCRGGGGDGWKEGSVSPSIAYVIQVQVNTSDGSTEVYPPKRKHVLL